MFDRSKKKKNSPKASKIVFASKICCCTHVETSHVTEQRYWRTNFVVSVFPAPDSPDITTAWCQEEIFICLELEKLKIVQCECIPDFHHCRWYFCKRLRLMQKRVAPISLFFVHDICTHDPIKRAREEEFKAKIM